MTKYIINKGMDNELTVEAQQFTVNEHWAAFYKEFQELVYATPAKYVVTIEAEGVASK
jgi:hypothetical protein